MGANNSRTRKLTIENEDASGVIKVSDEVVQRMRKGEAVRQQSNIGGEWQQQGQGDVIFPPSAVPPPYPFHYEPSLTSIQLRQQFSTELKKNDEYWMNRMNDLQKKHEKMAELMEYEYNKALDEMGYNQKKETEKKSKEIPCKEKQQMVLQCYKKYPNETMRCAKEVQEFTNCIDNESACAVEGDKR